MFSDVVLLHGSNSVGNALQAGSAMSPGERNVCSSEKMTQTGDGIVWSSPLPDHIQVHSTSSVYTMLHYTILHYATLYYTILYYTILHYVTLYYTTLYYTILHYATLYYTTLYYTMLHYATLYYTTLYYTMLHYTVARGALHT